MKRRRITLSLIVCMLVSLLSACTPSETPEMVMDLPEKPVVINVGMTSALAQYEEAVKACATGVEVLVDVLPWVRLQDEIEDVVLVYGEEDKELTEYVYQVGESELVFIVNPDLPVDSLTLNQVQEIFDGTMTDWIELSITSSYMGDIQLWGYMENTEIMTVVFGAIGLSDTSGQWQVALLPADIVAMVSQDQNAIGVVPAYAVTDEVTVLSLTDVESSVVPILAIWDHEPGEAEQDWLMCVQEAIKQD